MANRLGDLGGVIEEGSEEESTSDDEASVGSASLASTSLASASHGSSSHFASSHHDDNRSETNSEFSYNSNATSNLSHGTVGQGGDHHHHGQHMENLWPEHLPTLVQNESTEVRDRAKRWSEATA